MKDLHDEFKDNDDIRSILNLFDRGRLFAIRL